MLLDSSDMAVFLEALGEPVLVDDFTTITGIYDDQPKEIVQNGVAIWSDTPTLTVAAIDAEGIELNDTVLTVSGIEYQAFSRIPMRLQVQFHLTRDF